MEYSGRKAFTLIELLAVIVIIAILAAILFPALAGAKQSAKGSVEISNMRQVYIALTMYEEDHHERSPLTLGELRGYAGGDEVFSSPLDVFRLPSKDQEWTATPFIPCSGFFYPHKISFGYLRQFTPYDEDDAKWLEVRSNSSVGIIASPWRGAPGSSIGGALSCGEPVLSVGGPIMTGIVQRIQMDGSLYQLKAHSDKGAYGASMGDLFFNR